MDFFNIDELLGPSELLLIQPPSEKKPFTGASQAIPISSTWRKKSSLYMENKFCRMMDRETVAEGEQPLVSDP